MPRPVFVYGTLMLPVVQRRVCGRTFDARPATLAGFFRGVVAGERYPSLRPEAGGVVEGRLLDGVDDAALERLDRYEGARYERLEVEVDGAPAWAWLLSAAHRGLVTDEPWDLERFVAEDLERFSAEYDGFD